MTGNAIDITQLSYSYGDRQALHEVNLAVPEGSLYALLGPNGSGKTTLLQILSGMRRPGQGRVSLMGADRSALSWRDRETIGYVAEGQSLPGWMRLEQLESYLAPLYRTWDGALARDLRERFELDPSQKLKTLSRGQQMKAALLCALAPRPKLLIMDEPFTGMDALVKDDLVRGLLESAGANGWTVLICSHDIGELELLADWVGVLDAGHMVLSESMEETRARFTRVEVVAHAPLPPDQRWPGDWMSVEQSGTHLSFIVSHAGEDLESQVLAPRFGDARIDVRPATLRELFVALVRHPRAAGAAKVTQ
jgi:ABC-2 type transport system ATP-binding protein